MLPRPATAKKCSSAASSTARRTLSSGGGAGMVAGAPSMTSAGSSSDTRQPRRRRSSSTAGANSAARLEAVYSVRPVEGTRLREQHRGLDRTEHHHGMVAGIRRPHFEQDDVTLHRTPGAGRLVARERRR